MNEPKAKPREDQDDGLNPPADEAEAKRRLEQARAWLAKHPINMRPTQNFPEINGHWEDSSDQ